MKKLMLLAAIVGMVMVAAAPAFAQASTPPLPECTPETLAENPQDLPEGTYCCADGSWQLDPVEPPTYPGASPEPQCKNAYPGECIGECYSGSAGPDDEQYPEEPEVIPPAEVQYEGDNNVNVDTNIVINVQTPDGLDSVRIERVTDTEIICAFGTFERRDLDGSGKIEAIEDHSVAVAAFAAEKNLEVSQVQVVNVSGVNSVLASGSPSASASAPLVLPETGGSSAGLLALGAGALLVASGLLVRRINR